MLGLYSPPTKSPQIHSHFPTPSSSLSLFLKLKFNLCSLNTLESGACKRMWLTSQTEVTPLKKTDSFFPTSYQTVVTSLLGVDFLSTHPLHAGILSSLCWLRFCECCHICREFVSAPAVLCLECIVSWLSSTSDSYSLSAPSSVMIPGPCVEGV